MLNVIPYPNRVVYRQGKFVFSKNTQVNFFGFEGIEKYVKRAFDRAEKLLKEYKTPTTISFTVDDTLAEESYVVDIEESEITVTASTDKGALYAFSTLRQLLLIDTVEKDDLVRVDCVRIEDEPSMKYRGLLLDSARHFIPVKEVKEHLDVMALLKLNHLHFHLNDNQGWRIEIKKYPLLTEIGSKRKDSVISAWDDRDVKYEGKPHEGFYTQDEIRDIVAYASMLGITVIPEIDAPAHFYSALAAYPELSCTGEKVEVKASMGGVSFGDWDLIMCAGKEESYKFLFDVWDEVCELFPSPYVHVGGDEAPKGKWKKCPHCQAMMKKLGLKNEEDLQGYLENSLIEHLAKKGKRVIGWNEILAADNISKDSVVQYWTTRQDERAEKFIAEGGSAIMSRNQVFYFDMSYGYVHLKKIYDYTHEKYGARKSDNIIGAECTLWSEFLHTRDIRNLKLYPRLQAFSEVTWTRKENKNYRSFVDRFYSGMAPILDRYDIDYALPEVACPGLKERIIGNQRFVSGNPNYDYEKNLKLKKDMLK